MTIDVLCLTEKQQQELNELLTACRWLVDAKKLNMADSAITHGISKIAAVINKIDKVAA
jgi:hypothetical protein